MADSGLCGDQMYRRKSRGYHEQNEQIIIKIINYKGRNESTIYFPRFTLILRNMSASSQVSCSAIHTSVSEKKSSHLVAPENVK